MWLTAESARSGDAAAEGLEEAPATAEEVIGGRMGLTWIAMAASLLMGGGALLVFIWAVRSQQFKSFEDVKYQVFWSDLEGPFTQPASPRTNKEQRDGSSTQGS